MSKQNIIEFTKNHRGSILAYSLIILAMMMAIATSLSLSTIIAKKASSGTEFSMQSLQTADSGVQLALKKINSATGDLSSALGCVNSKVTGTDAGPTDSSYELTFFNDTAPTTPLACSALVSEVRNIKSIGTYKNTVRAVSVAVAAGTLQCQSNSVTTLGTDASVNCAAGYTVVTGGGCSPNTNGDVRSFRPTATGFVCNGDGGIAPASMTATVVCCK